MLALMSLPGIGPVRCRKLLAAAGSYEAAWRDLAAAAAGAGLPDGVRRQVLTAHAVTDPAACIGRLEQLGIRALFPGDVEYAAGFAAMHDPPVVLYIRGGLAGRDRLACAVVGTRLASPYGRWITTKLAAGLARAGVTVVSGLARGIDASAHHAALAAGGRTIAVLAGGLDRIYPVEHEPLAGQIERSGALISEYPPGVPARAGSFVVRNRLIAALGLATLVTEAGRRSGAMITARYAMEYGRDVMAVPGRVGDPGAAGVNELIRDGAGLVETTQDALAVLGLAETAAGDTQPIADPAAGERDSDELPSRLIQLLANGPLSEDQLLARSGRAPGAVRAQLTMLELQGRISRWSGGVYCLVERVP